MPIIGYAQLIGEETNQHQQAFTAERVFYQMSERLGDRC